MKWLRTYTHRLFGDYALYRIYSLELSDCAEPPRDDCIFQPIDNMEQITRSADASIRKLAEYSGAEAFGLGVWVSGEPASVCWFWAGDRYKERDFWPLRSDQAKLVQITTAERYRGRGLALKLLAYAGSEMKKKGYRRLFARIWHSNRSSIAVFEKAGWRYVAFVMELHPLGRKKPWRFVFRR